jgi:hypothetical protein
VKTSTKLIAFIFSLSNRHIPTLFDCPLLIVAEQPIAQDQGEISISMVVAKRKTTPVVDSKYGEILGAHLIGPEVTELLPELTLAHMMELTPAEIARNVHAHPTLSEVIMEAAHGAEGSPIHI